MIDFLVYKDLSRGKSIHVLHEFFDPQPRSSSTAGSGTGHSRRNGGTARSMSSGIQSRGVFAPR